MTPEILSVLNSDPFTRTIGQLVREREDARREIIRLNDRIDRLERQLHGAQTIKLKVEKNELGVSRPISDDSLLRMRDPCKLVDYQRVRSTAKSATAYSQSLFELASDPSGGEWGMSGNGYRAWKVNEAAETAPSS